MFRTSVFYVLGAAVLATDIVSPPIGSWLLEKDVWLPFLLGSPLIVLGFPILCLLPETLSDVDAKDTTGGDTVHVAQSEEPPTKVGQICYKPHYTITLANYVDRKRPFFNFNLGGVRKHLRSYISFDSNFTLCLLIVFINAFSQQVMRLFKQFTSRRLGWSLAKTGYLTSIRV